METTHLVASSMNGDHKSIGILFQYYRPRLLSHALRLCGNTPFAHDAVQETFLNAYSKIHTLRNAEMFYPWLRRILFNVCFQILRKEKGRNDLKNVSDTDLLFSIEDRFENAANNQRVHAALNELSDELRSCILLRYFSSYNSYEQIALILGIPVGTVRSRLAAGREKLSQLYALKEDSGVQAIRQSQYWSKYYEDTWGTMYDDHRSRTEIFRHLLPGVFVRFTSGKTDTGRKIIEKEVDKDLYYGSRFNLTDVSSSGNISVVEGYNTNDERYPDRCAPESAFILFRKEGKIERFHIFDSARS